MIKTYRKNPILIQAIKFETNNEPDDKNMNAIVKWINQGAIHDGIHAWHNGTDIFIQNLDKRMKAEVGDFIIRGVSNEFYPCKPDIFEKTYEEV